MNTGSEKNAPCAVGYLAESSEPGEARPGYLEMLRRGAAHFDLSVAYCRRLEVLGGWGPFFSAARRELRALSARIEADALGTAKPWGGAKVELVSKTPNPQSGGFYAPPRYVVTRRVPELSWAFQEITEVLSSKPFYSFETKFEIFARLADAADRAEKQARSPPT